MNENEPPAGTHCPQVWSKPFVGSDYDDVPLFPDGNATYWYYAITRSSTTDSTGILLRGQFGHARYQSITVYDDETGEPVASLADIETMPVAGNRNPYLLAIDRDTPERTYEIAIVPEGADTDYANVIEFPSNLVYLSVFLRVYLPDADVVAEPDGYSGGVPLPEILAFDTSTGGAAPCPETRDDPRKIDTEPGLPEFPLPVGDRLSFYNISPSGFYGTPDNHYLTAPIGRVKDTVAVFRLKPPTYADTSDPAGVAHYEPEVRYWSFIVCSAQTYTSACLADYQTVVAPDGFAYVVFGPDDPAVRKKAAGLNFVPWGDYKITVLIYRNLLANASFPYSNAEVPLYHSGVPQEDQAAQEYLGDYAPVGNRCSVEAFLRDFGGMDLSGAVPA